MSVMVDGDIIQIYEPLNTFLKNDKWLVKYDEYKEKMKSLEERRITLVSKKSDDVEMDMTIKNWEENDGSIENATIIDVTIKRSIADVVSVELPENLIFGDSIKDAIKALGTPSGFNTSVFDDEVENSMSYLSNPDGLKSNQVYFNFIDDELEWIRFMAAYNTKRLEKNNSFDIKKVYGVNPILDLNKIGKANKTLDKGSIQINDRVMTKESKVNDLLEDGWIVVNWSAEGDNSKALLEKGNERIMVISEEIYDGNVETLKNSNIIEYLLSKDNDSENIYILPGGVNSKDTFESFISTYGFPLMYDYSGDSIYITFGKNYGCSLYVAFDNEQKAFLIKYNLRDIVK